MTALVPMNQSKQMEKINHTNLKSIKVETTSMEYDSTKY